jgi:GNAT superfamily N-acetyltransferase
VTGNWRAMTADDLPAAYEMSKTIHPAFPEDFAVMAEKFRLFPSGCFFAPGAGYAVSHPWAGPPPPLNRPLGRLPEHPTLYDIHDVAIFAAARGVGFGREIVARIKSVATGRGLGRLGLVAVNGSVPFWQRQGFAVHPLPAEKLASYGPDARYMEAQI